MTLTRVRLLPPRVLRFAAILAVAVAGACDSPSDSDDAPGLPARVEITSGNDQRARVGTELAQPLVARVLDEDGRPVPNAVVNFRVTSGGGSVFTGAVQADAKGEARERWTLGTVTADSQRVEVRVSNAATANPVALATFRAVADADAPARVEAVSGSGQAGSSGAALPDSLAARVLDRFSNPVPGAAVTWTVVSGGGQITPTSTSNAAGIAKAVWTLGARLDSAQVAEVSVGTTTRARFSALAGVTPGTRFTKTGGDAQTGPILARLPQPLKVVVLHENGTPVVGVTVGWQQSLGSGYVTQPTSVTNAQGEAVTEWVLGEKTGTRTVTAVLTPGTFTETQPVVFTATPTPGAPNLILKVAGDRAGGAGEAGPISVVVTDMYGNPTPNVDVTWTGSPELVFEPRVSRTDARGIAQGTVTLPGRVGNYTAFGTSGTLRSPQFDMYAGPGAIATYTTDATSVTVAVGSNTSVRVVAKDRFGNLVLARFATAVSANETVAQAGTDSFARGESARIIITGKSPGQTTITVGEGQGSNPSITTTIAVTVR